MDLRTKISGVGHKTRTLTTDTCAVHFTSVVIPILAPAAWFPVSFIISPAAMPTCIFMRSDPLVKAHSSGLDSARKWRRTHGSWVPPALQLLQVFFSATGRQIRRSPDGRILSNQQLLSLAVDKRRVFSVHDQRVALQASGTDFAQIPIGRTLLSKIYEHSIAWE